MPISYVGKAFVLAANSGTAIAVPMPSGLAAGHKLYVLLGSVASNATDITPPAGSGFALVKNVTTGSNLRGQLYTKTAVSGDAGATFTFTSGNSGRYFGYSVAYSGVDVAASDLADATGTTDAGAGPWATPSLNVSDGDWLLTAGLGRESPGTATAKNWTTTDTSDSERFDNATAAEPSVNITAALFDSGRPLTAGSVSRSLSSGASLGQSQVWAVRIPALADAAPAGGNPWTGWGVPIR
jgi:hypothetical protein